MSRFALFLAAVALIAAIGLNMSYPASGAPPRPEPQPVVEQNVDANGYIRVHEQGTTTVTGQVNVGNLPVDASGDLKVASVPTTGKQFTLATGLSVPANTGVQTGFVDVKGCTRFSAFTEGGAEIYSRLVVSFDGVASYGLSDGGRTKEGGQNVATYYQGWWVAPYAAVNAFNGSPNTASVNVHLYCLP